MEIRYRPTAEDGMHAMRATTQPAWALFLFVLLLGLMFLVGIYLVDHDLAGIGWTWPVLSAVLGILMYHSPQPSPTLQREESFGTRRDRPQHYRCWH